MKWSKVVDWFSFPKLLLVCITRATSFNQSERRLLFSQPITSRDLAFTGGMFSRACCRIHVSRAFCRFFFLLIGVLISLVFLLQQCVKNWIFFVFFCVFLVRHKRQGRQLTLHHEMGVTSEHKRNCCTNWWLQIPSPELRKKVFYFDKQLNDVVDCSLTFRTERSAKEGRDMTTCIREQRSMGLGWE